MIVKSEKKARKKPRGYEEQKKENPIKRVFTRAIGGFELSAARKPFTVPHFCRCRRDLPMKIEAGLAVVNPHSVRIQRRF
jgi:hypothetical protein